jgi:hypothetical protein
MTGTWDIAWTEAEIRPLAYGAAHGLEHGAAYGADLERTAQGAAGAWDGPEAPAQWWALLHLLWFASVIGGVFPDPDPSP